MNLVFVNNIKRFYNDCVNQLLELLLCTKCRMSLVKNLYFCFGFSYTMDTMFCCIFFN